MKFLAFISGYLKSGKAKLESEVIFGNFEGIWNLSDSRETLILSQNFNFGSCGECPLLNSLPQSEYEGAILVIKDKLRKGNVELSEIEQILEDKYQAMKHMSRAGMKRKMIMPSSQANPIRKSPRKHLKNIVGAVENLDIKQ